MCGIFHCELLLRSGLEISRVAAFFSGPNFGFASCVNFFSSREFASCGWEGVSKSGGKVAIRKDDCDVSFQPENLPAIVCELLIWVESVVLHGLWGCSYTGSLSPSHRRMCATVCCVAECIQITNQTTKKVVDFTPPLPYTP